MIIRQLNEFVRESVVLALEPARECKCSCVYCFAALNSSVQYGDRSKSLEDDGSFERAIAKAYGPGYDPTNFIEWCLRNRMALGFANTVEPFQSLEQAKATLSCCDRLGIPLFIQTKGLNFHEVAPLLSSMHDNLSVFVSIPSLNQEVARRFEPGTPPIAERLKIITWLADHGIWTIAALSPYHEEWVEDPVALIEALYSAGADEIFFDRLHLNQRQAKSSRDRVMVDLARTPWNPKAYDHLFNIYGHATEWGLDFFMPSFIGTVNGRPNTIPSISPDSCFRRGRAWPYYDGRVFRLLEDSFYSEGIDPRERNPLDSIIVKWSDCLAIMEAGGNAIDQPFNYRSLYDLVHIGRKLPDEWKEAVGKHKDRPSPIREWFRAMWNTPLKNQFMWRHPALKYAVRPGGVPWLDEGGNLIGLFDPDYISAAPSRPEESLEGFRSLEYD